MPLGAVGWTEGEVDRQGKVKRAPRTSQMVHLSALRPPRPLLVYTLEPKRNEAQEAPNQPELPRATDKSSDHAHPLPSYIDGSVLYQYQG